MREKLLTAVCVLLMIVPWTILPLRSFDWALQSPAAEIMIACYAVFMILSGVFTVFFYTKGKAQNSLMKACLVINSLYLAAGIGFLGLMAYTRFMR